MKVASLDLCKELYELTGWHKTDYYYDAENEVSFWEIALSMHPTKNCPAYDLGYLLRKLPGYIVLERMEKSWRATQVYENDGSNEFYADTPEDAACKLAIELIKQGVIHV